MIDYDLYLGRKAEKPEKDALLIREVVEKRVRMVYGDYCTDEQLNEVFDLACRNRTTGEAIGWILENFNEDAKYEPPEEKFKALEGGLAEEMTPEEIAEKHGVDLKDIEKQLEMGREVEKEHTDDPEVAERIAMDHLVEIPDYYTRLKKMEEEADKELGLKD